MARMDTQPPRLLDLYGLFLNLVPSHPCLQYTGSSRYTAMQTATSYRSLTGKNVGSWQTMYCTWTINFICERPQSAYACQTIEEPPEPPASPFCESACGCFTG
jgi:hypothetical protein